MVENKPTSSSSAPGDGIKSMRATNLFRVVNFELYAKPNKIIMGIGLTLFSFSLAYMAYMRHTYESMGYQSEIAEDGTEMYKKRRSKWD